LSHTQDATLEQNPANNRTRGILLVTGSKRYNPPMDNNGKSAGGFLSGEAKQQEQRSLTPWIVAGGVVLVVVAGLLIASYTHARPAAGGAPDAYASQLAISDIALSQSSNMAGSQITYVDGTIANHGNRVVDSVTVETAFHLAGGSGPQLLSTPLSLIRTRDPYIDIEPVSADPIKPGESKSFRLIFDHVSADWDQQNPDVRVLQVHLR
jgi:hypothetical protein